MHENYIIRCSYQYIIRWESYYIIRCSTEEIGVTKHSFAWNVLRDYASVRLCVSKQNLLISLRHAQEELVIEDSKISQLVTSQAHSALPRRFLLATFKSTFLSDEGQMHETLDFTFRIGSTPTFSYFDLYLYTAYAAHCFYFTFKTRYSKQDTLGNTYLLKLIVIPCSNHLSMTNLSIREK